MILSDRETRAVRARGTIPAGVVSRCGSASLEPLDSQLRDSDETGPVRRTASRVDLSRPKVEWGIS